MDSRILILFSGLPFVTTVIHFEAQIAPGLVNDRPFKLDRSDYGSNSLLPPQFFPSCVHTLYHVTLQPALCDSDLKLLNRVTCFGRWDFSRGAASRGFESACPVGLVCKCLCHGHRNAPSLPSLACCSREEAGAEQSHLADPQICKLTKCFFFTTEVFLAVC